jgi:signal recognition particle subunit SRP54
MDDFRDQLQQMKSMGGISGVMDKMPGMGGMPAMAQQPQSGDEMFFRMEVIIDSMTAKERRHSEIINGSRKKRIAAGSGTQIQDVNRLLKQHKQMSKMMKKMNSKGGGMAKMMRGLGGLKGKSLAGMMSGGR